MKKIIGLLLGLTLLSGCISEEEKKYKKIIQLEKIQKSLPDECVVIPLEDYGNNKDMLMIWCKTKNTVSYNYSIEKQEGKNTYLLPSSNFSIVE